MCVQRWLGFWRRGGADKSQQSHSEAISSWFACPSTVPPLSQQPNRLMMHLEVALGGVHTAERCVSRSAPTRMRPIAREPILHYTKAPSHNKAVEWWETQEQQKLVERRKEFLGFFAKRSIKQKVKKKKKKGRKEKRDKERRERKKRKKKKENRQKRGQMSEQGFSSAVGVKENATNNEMSILPTSSLSLSLLRLFSSGPHYQCTWTRG